MSEKETLVERIQRVYKIKLRVCKDCSLEDLFYVYGLPSMKSKLTK